jgi:hypothetical protein
MTITQEQLENYRSQIRGMEAEIDLHEKELSAWQARGEAERNLYGWLAEFTIDPAVSRRPLDKYREAHQEHYKAQAELKQLAIVRMKLEANTLRELVKEADRSQLGLGGRRGGLLA